MDDLGMKQKMRRWLWLATLLVLALGAVEGWFGKTDSGDVFGSDAVQYLDCARAMERGDWHSALDPLWSQGYPALLAVARPLFGAGAWGDWLDTRVVNFVCFGFTWGCFCFLLGEIALRSRLKLAGAVAVFVGMQICLEQVSRVGPDQLLAGFFFLVCALVLRLRQKPGVAVWLGLALGVGFVVKAVFLALGCLVLVVAAWVVRRHVVLLLPAVVVFGVIVVGYGAMLSRAVGRVTLGDSGSLNYAWHVDRLAKWVHWEGGVETAAEAWPKPWLGRFVGWDTSPPDFGAPVHPSVRVGTVPVVYVFKEPVVATYVPYYDPAYWYQGYKHVVRWRYQLVAVGKNLGDLVGVVVRSPLLIGLILVGMPGWWLRSRFAGRVTAGNAGVLRAAQDDGEKRSTLAEEQGMMQHGSGLWPVVLVACLGVALYVPVHLEGRYLSAYFAVLGVAVVTGSKRRWMSWVVIGAAIVGLVTTQHQVWGRAVHGWSPRANEEWRAGEAVASLLPVGSEVGSVSWTPALHCDWAYLSRVRIVAEIASPADEKMFWGLSDAGRAAVLERFRAAGARAVMSWDRPPDGASGWTELPGVAMWVYRF